MKLNGLNLQDGQIDYGEFAAMMRKGNSGGIGRRTMMRSNLNLADALGVGAGGAGGAGQVTTTSSEASTTTTTTSSITTPNLL